MEQIRDKDYTQTLWQEGYKKMVQYGIAFHLKQCCVMEEEMQRKRNRDGALNRYNLYKIQGRNIALNFIYGQVSVNIFRSI